MMPHCAAGGGLCLNCDSAGLLLSNCTHALLPPPLPTGMPSTFAELAEAVRSCKQTALGYLRSSDGACVLAPPAEEQIIWQPGDRIVVVAEEY